MARTGDRAHHADKNRIRCGRCGVPMFLNPRAKAGGLCLDCRSTDRVYVKRTHDYYVIDSERRRRLQEWLRARDVDVRSRVGA